MYKSPCFLFWEDFKKLKGKKKKEKGKKKIELMDNDRKLGRLKVQKSLVLMGETLQKIKVLSDQSKEFALFTKYQKSSKTIICTGSFPVP